jgi:hypothetical protein
MFLSSSFQALEKRMPDSAPININMVADKIVKRDIEWEYE